MIKGRFGDKAQIYFDIDLIDESGLNFTVEAMLDTGFTEFLAINQQDVETLGWTLLGQDLLRTAQGETFFNIYLGKVIIDTKEFEITAQAGAEIQEILLGSQWLKLFTLVSNYAQYDVCLEQI